MIEFRRNNETGMLEVWKDGVYVGQVVTMGDEVNSKNERNN